MITEEDKSYIVQQLDKLLNGRPAFYLKFCAEELFAKNVCNGDFYANTPMYFRQREIEVGERGQGDQYELILPFRAENVTMYNAETGNLIANIKETDIKIQFKDDDAIPMVSFVGIPLKDMILMDASENGAVFRLPFTEEEYREMSKKFGPYCVVISGRELENRIAECCNEGSVEYIFDAVEYCDVNYLDRMRAFGGCESTRFLYKNSDLKYQREYRLVLALEMPEDHFIKFGRMGSAQILDSKVLKDLAFEIKFHVEDGGGLE